MNEELIFVEQVKAAMSPTVMVMACATLVWTLQNKFSVMVRVFKKLTKQATLRGGEPLELSILEQLHFLKKRARLLSFSIAMLYLALSLFLACSVFLFARGGREVSHGWLIVPVFMMGLTCMLLAMGFAWRDALLSFAAIHREVQMKTLGD